MTESWQNEESLMELWRPDSWLFDRDYEIHISGAVPCVHGWLPTDPDVSSECRCWDARA